MPPGYYCSFARIQTVLATAVVLFSVISGKSMSQIDPEDWIEPTDPEDGQEESSSLDQLQWLRDHPVDLNSATAGMLCSIPGIDPSDAARVIAYRAQNGMFKATDELFLVPNLSIDAARRLGEFTTVDAGSGRGDPLRIDLRARTMRDLQMRDGFRTGAYHGSPDKSYARLTGSMGKTVEAGVLVEKDAGETPSAGFLSGYLKLSEIPAIDQLIVGDFRFETGEGLVFWEGSGFGTDPVAGGTRSPRGLVPHRSTDEFHFLRGAGMSTSFSVKGISITFSGFVSNRQLPGTTNEAGVVTGFQEGGLFRTDTELSKVDAMGEFVAGGSILANAAGSLILGVSGFSHRFSRRVEVDGSLIPGGEGRAVGGLHAGWSGDRVNLAGELAAGEGGGIAWLVRGTVSAGRTGRLVMLYRDYPHDFNGLHSSGFGARADTRNERGCYLGFTFRPQTGIHTSLFVDHFAFPRPTGTIPIPSDGFDAGLNIDARLGGATELTARSTLGRAQEVEPGIDWQGRVVSVLKEVDRRSFRLTLVHQSGEQVRLKTRIERTEVVGGSGGDEEGIMLFQDVRFQSGAGFSIEARLVFFQTDSWNTRIYEFENDVPGAFSVPVLYGSGRRWYVLGKYEILGGVHFSLKLSETQKEGVRFLGSGLGEIEGDRETRVTVQVDMGI
jgi:hypothetical protein